MVATVSFEMEGAAPNVCGYACFRESQNNDSVVKWSTHSAIAQNPSLMGETSGTPSTNHTPNSFARHACGADGLPHSAVYRAELGKI
jgi:hypothetical protein